MILGIFVALLAVLSSCTKADGVNIDRELKESVTLRVRYASNVRLTEQKMRQVLKEADFEGHGFKKEESRSLVSEGRLAANSSAYMTNRFYHREVDCSRSQVMQVLQDEGKRLPDTMKPSRESQEQLVEEMEVFMAAKGRAAKCKTGIEVHSKSDFLYRPNPHRFRRGLNVTFNIFCLKVTIECCRKVTIKCCN